MDVILDRLSSTVTSARTLEELVRPLLELLEAITGLASTYLTTIDEGQGLQHILFARNMSTLVIPEGLSVRWTDTLCKRALDSGQLFTDNVAECWGDSDAARGLGIKTYLSAPVRLGDEDLYGTLCAASDMQQVVSADAQRILRLFAKLIADHVERERLMEQLVNANDRLARSAYLDPLTEMPNRRAMHDELERLLAIEKRAGTWVLVAFVDLDGFKQINDTHGHEIGDRFLQEIARRLRSTLRVADIGARLGGDEFVVAGVGPDKAERVTSAKRKFQERIFAATEGDYQLGDVLLAYRGASVGVIAVGPGTLNADEAIREADAAMYVVKRSRKTNEDVRPR
jgi:diguanylate cyclase